MAVLTTQISVRMAFLPLDSGNVRVQIDMIQGNPQRTASKLVPGSFDDLGEAYLAGEEVMRSTFLNMVKDQ